MEPMRILIADDQPEVRSAVRLILGQEPYVNIVGEAGDILGVLELVARQHPDLVLLDWELTGRQSALALRDIRKAHPDAMVVALSGRPEARPKALAAGVNAFVSKGEPPERLLETLARCYEKVAIAVSALEQISLDVS
ncbi:MAG: response regulator transcription factor [Anaerolineales bacterium]